MHPFIYIIRWDISNVTHACITFPAMLILRISPIVEHLNNTEIKFRAILGTVDRVNFANFVLRNTSMTNVHTRAFLTWYAISKKAHS